MTSHARREFRLRRVEAQRGEKTVLLLAFGDLPPHLLSPIDIGHIREELAKPSPEFEPAVAKRLAAGLAELEGRPRRTRTYAIITEADYAMA